MNELQQQTADILVQFADRLHEISVGGTLGSEMDRVATEVYRLAGEVPSECVVAVVGRVKAGKSTFLNALLDEEEDLAQVGILETTATINYFSYGNPDPAKPILCHLRDSDQAIPVSREFLKELQGNDLETLRRADGIAYLEYRLPNPYLKQVTLVDTPGTGAVVNEHQNRTAEFMRLSSELRERHHRETERLGSKADAVVYLVGAVARAGDREFLEEFSHATGGQARATNALGVMAKIDLFPDVLERRGELTEKVAAQLRDELNTVVPVSAGLERALQKLCRGKSDKFQRMEQLLENVPKDVLKVLLDSDEIFRCVDLPKCEVGPKERAALLEGFDWGVFCILARMAAESRYTTEEKLARLREISGFTSLREVIERCFFERGHLLRCFRVIRDARRKLDIIKYTYLPAVRKLDREGVGRLGRFLGLIHSSNGEPAVVADLEQFLYSHLTSDVERRLADLHAEFDRRLAGLFHELTACNEEFEALQQLQRTPGPFLEPELQELRPLFGLYGTSADQRLGGRIDSKLTRERMRAWRQAELISAQGTLRQVVAQHAVRRYGILLDKLLRS